MVERDLYFCLSCMPNASVFMCDDAESSSNVWFSNPFFWFQDARIKSETRANPLDLPLYQPLDILQRLGLPPPKDLESLLLDAAKPTVSSKNTPEMRSVKQIARRVSLPPFPWSHTSSGHCRTSSDVVKLSTSKGTCQGRWQRIGRNNSIALDITTSNLTDLESLTYDQNLVPSGLKVAPLDHEISPQISSSLTGCAWDSLASCSKGPSVSLGNYFFEVAFMSSFTHQSLPLSCFSDSYFPLRFN